ncbi:MAG: helix-turn-helix domain-containing protein [Clostridium sp.]|nr:helix-turn-helix domain-containing protein [Clostridium sp.]
MSVNFQERVNLGMQLRINRIRAGLSVKELARKSSISATSINWVENGRSKNIRLDSIIRIADTLNISLEEIIVERIAI